MSTEVITAKINKLTMSVQFVYQLLIIKEYQETCIEDEGVTIPNEEIGGEFFINYSQRDGRKVKIQSWH